MSAIYFTTRSRTTTVTGSERARAMQLVGEITGRVLELDTPRGQTRAQRILPKDYYPFAAMTLNLGGDPGTPVEQFARWSAMVTIMGNAELRIIPAQRTSINASLDAAITQPAPETVLNTAIAEGTEAEVLLARISGSVEHGLLIPAEDRAWMAQIIAAGSREGGALHPQRDRWSEVARHLADFVADPGPALLTCSQGYSVHDLGAKATGVWDIHDENAQEQALDEWAQLPLAQRWDRSIDAIITDRADKPWLVLTPDTFREKNYAQGYCAADAVREHDAWWKRNVTDQMHRVSDLDSPAERVQNAGRARPADPDSPMVIYPAADDVARDFLDWLHSPKGRVSREDLAREAANASRAGRKITRFEPVVPTVEDRDFNPMPPGSYTVADPLRGVYRNSGVGREYIGPDAESEDQP